MYSSPCIPSLHTLILSFSSRPLLSYTPALSSDISLEIVPLHPPHLHTAFQYYSHLTFYHCIILTQSSHFVILSVWPNHLRLLHSIPSTIPHLIPSPLPYILSLLSLSFLCIHYRHSSSNLFQPFRFLTFVFSFHAHVSLVYMIISTIIIPSCSPFF